MNTALILLLSGSLTLADRPISFQELAPGDSIQVKYTSTGCWHHLVYEFAFRRAATTTAEITRIETRWDDKKEREVETRRTVLGTVTLSPADLAGLDRLMTFYRSKHPGGCTTVDRVTVTRKSGGTETSTESYMDATCDSGSIKGLFSFPAVAAKLKPKKP